MKKVDCLDGLRGVAALWVVFGHALILTGWRLPIIGQPDLGVDLFILLSGFLMVFQANLRSTKEDWTDKWTWVGFWVRRFFRIAPLYYVLLMIGLLAGSAIYDARVDIDTALGKSLQASSRYEDSSLTNILLHITFLFGLIPQYAFRTPLPDWSIGLEMQFYAAFPFIYLLARRLGWPAAMLGLAVAGVAVAIGLSAAGISFPMPAFLALKIHVFAAGMLIAAAMNVPRSTVGIYLALAAALIAIPIGGKADMRHLLTREAILLAFFALVHWRSIGAIDSVARVFASPPLHWLGEMSFGVYLFHLLFMHHAAAWTFGFASLSPAERFALTCAVTLPLSYGGAALTYRFVEMPGQAWGKTVAARITGKRSAGVQTGAEDIAAP